MRTVVFQGQWFSILVDASGTEFVHTGDEVLVVALTAEGEVLLTVEPSAAFGEPTLILPGGETEPGEPHDVTANRELQEEVGYKAGRLDFLGELRPFSKYLTVRCFCYLARDLMPSRRARDEDYAINVERVPLASFEQWIAAGRLLDARVVAVLYMARDFLKGGGKMSSVAPFEEYKLFVEDTARFTDRRQTVTNICVTINSVLLSAVALLVKDAGLQRWVLVPATITIFVAGIAICVVWWQLICKYKRLVKLRINKLRAMENLPEMAGCQKMYHAEDDMYKRDTKDQLIEGIASSFSDLERFLPFVFMFLYLVFGIAIVVARCQGLI